MDRIDLERFAYAVVEDVMDYNIYTSADQFSYKPKSDKRISYSGFI